MCDHREGKGREGRRIVDKPCIGQKASRCATLAEKRLTTDLTRPRLRTPELNQDADTAIQIEMICGNWIQISGATDSSNAVCDRQVDLTCGQGVFKSY